MIGFIPAAYTVGYLSEKGMTKKISATFISMIIGTAIIFLFGVIWLLITAGMQNALVIGLYPYLIGAGIKITFATVIVYSINRINK